MRRLKYYDINPGTDAREFKYELLRKADESGLIEEMVQEAKKLHVSKSLFVLPMEIKTRLHWPLEILFEILGTDWTGKTVLDLGCGARDTADIECNWAGGFDPWICRFLKKFDNLGGRVIGIDCGNLSGETFEYYQLDLLDPNCLSFLPDNSVNVAHMKYVYGSPELTKRVTGKVVFGDLPLGKEKLDASLIPQLERVLVKDGIFLNREFYHGHPS